MVVPRLVSLLRYCLTRAVVREGWRLSSASSILHGALCVDNSKVSFPMNTTGNGGYPAGMLADWAARMAAAQEVTTLVVSGVRLERVPFGSEAGISVNTQPCHDCLVQKGQYHVLGCDAEDCPNCAGPLISCGCWTDEDDKACHLLVNWRNED